MGNSKRLIKGGVALKFALVTMAVAVVGVSLMAWLSFKEANRIFRKHSAVTLASETKLYAQSVSKRIGALKYDLTMLALSDALKGFARAVHDPDGYDEKTNKTAAQFKQEVADLFKVMVEQNRPYFKIRVVDARNGRELVRVDRFINDTIAVAPDSRLQDSLVQSDLRACLKLARGQIYLSDITLNRQNGEIEMPYRPALRAGQLLFWHGQPGLIVMIDADVRRLFDFERFGKEKGLRTYLADERGYYIYNPADPLKEFGFEFGRPFRIFDDFPLRPLYQSNKARIAWYDKYEKRLFEALKIALDAHRFVVVLKQSDSAILQEQSREYIFKLALYAGVIVFLMALVAALTAWRMTRPIVKLSRYARQIAHSQGRDKIGISIRTGDEIEELARSVEAMLDALLKSRAEIERFAQRLEGEVQKKTEDLQRLNKELEQKVREGIEELRKKEEALMQSAKLADMGEMIGAIAHQWRQPLNALALNIQMLEDMAAAGELNEEAIESFVEKNMKTIRFMSKTIDDFRNFYREEKERKRFSLKQAVEDTLALQQAQLEARKIVLEPHLLEVEVEGFRNDVMQVVLNLLSNARDAVTQRLQTEEGFKGKIRVETLREGDEAVIRVADNGGGVPEEIVNRIFEPYFTTKEEGKGTGLGLHMARRIIEEKLGGRLLFQNGPEGAIFEIRLKAADA